MKKIKFLLSSVFVVFTFVVNAQQRNQMPKSNNVDVPASTVVTEEKKSPHGHILLQESPEILRANSSQSKPSASGVRGTEIIGEGQYLNRDKVIMERSISGQIPKDFPKHIVGQTPEQYREVVMNWARQNLHLIKPEYHHEIK